MDSDVLDLAKADVVDARALVALHALEIVIKYIVTENYLLLCLI